MINNSNDNKNSNSNDNINNNDNDNDNKNKKNNIINKNTPKFIGGDWFPAQTTSRRQYYLELCCATSLIDVFVLCSGSAYFIFRTCLKHSTIAKI